MKRTLIVLALWLAVSAAFAHGLRTAYLDLREENPGEFSVFWKTQIVAGALTVLEPGFSGQIQITEPRVSRETANAIVQTWRLRAVEPLRGQTLHIEGLSTAMDDALVRLEFADGTTWVKRLTAAEPSALIPPAQSGWSVAWEYMQLGIEHILLGIDHLLFVLALLIITQGTLRLLKTVTAFTVAHSITLRLATLGLVHVPSKPVEAVIALSIVFVAIEIIHARRGRIGLTAKAPWVVAFTFGLLHGFGFAGALSELGVPSGHVPTALLFFNVGVELGQFAFIMVVLIFIKITQSLRSGLPHWTELVPPYVIGSVAMLWVLQRTASF
jgi:hydrogenase/urease accessory protein HupE